MIWKVSSVLKVSFKKLWFIDIQLFGQRLRLCNWKEWSQRAKLHAEIEEILPDDNDVDGATEIRNFLATIITNKNLSGSAGNYLWKEGKPNN